MESKPVILDTDMDTDVDDVGATACLHALADRGEADVLGTFVSSRYPTSPLCLDAINRYYGRSDLPLGRLRRDGASTHRGSRYADEIAAEFPHRFENPDQVPDAIPLYRQILAEAEPTSVTIVTIGYASNIRFLLRSEPDAHSPLSGYELVAERVAEWVCMGGRFPEQTDPAEYGNFKPDPGAIREATDRWPESVPVTFFGGELGKPVQTGRRLLEEGPIESPVRRAYELWLGDTGMETRHSSDQGAILYAVRGLDDRWDRRTDGYLHLFEDGTHEWRPGSDRNQSHLLANADPDRIAREIEELMLRSPARQREQD